MLVNDQRGVRLVDWDFALDGLLAGGAHLVVGALVGLTQPSVGTSLAASGCTTSSVAPSG